MKIHALWIQITILHSPFCKSPNPLYMFIVMFNLLEEDYNRINVMFLMKKKH